jgi:hypothetical protein
MLRPFFAACFTFAIIIVAHAETPAPSAPASTAPTSTTRASITIEQQPSVNPWTSLDVQNDPENFQIAIVSDRTGGARPGIFEDAITKLNLLHPEFVMTVGDMIQGYTENKKALDREWEEFNGFVKQLKMPFFYLPGNHDVSNGTQREDYKKRFGRLYYHFTYHDVLFLCLCTDEPEQGRMSDEQVEYFRKALDENKSARWTLVFMHRPLWSEKREGGNNFDKFEKLLSGRKYTVIAGHVHTYLKHERNDSRYITLATTGGGSSLLGPIFGTFDQIGWLTMTKDGPVLANLALKGIWDDNLRTDESAKLIADLRRSAQLSFPTIAISGPTFSSTPLQLRITNDADTAMRFNAEFAAHPQVHVSPHAIDRMIPPNSVELVDLKLACDEPVSIDAIQPVMMNVSMSYALPDRPLIDFRSTHSIGIEGPLQVPHITEPVVIDGQLNEWKELPHGSGLPVTTDGNASSWMGVNDGSFRFGVRHDDRFVYIGINAIDDRIRTDAEAKGRFEDSLRVRLDARPAAQRKPVNPKKEDDFFSIVAIRPGEAPDAPFAVNLKQAAPGAKAAAVKTDTGYSAEIAIPFAYLDQKQGKAWEDFRLNVTMLDSDDPGMPSVELWWRPDWNRATNYPASGTFHRAK